MASETGESAHPQTCAAENYVSQTCSSPEE